MFFLDSMSTILGHPQHSVDRTSSSTARTIHKAGLLSHCVAHGVRQPFWETTVPAGYVKHLFVSWMQLASIAL